jgi:hypothetical protein
MKKIDIYKSYLLLVTSLVFVSCGGLEPRVNPDTGKKYSEKEYKIILDRRNFEESIDAIATIKVDKNAKVVGTMLLEPGNPILYVIKMNGIKNVHGIKVTENQYLNIDRVMIDHTDYFWDPVGHELLIKFNIPHVYLLNKEIRIKLEIVIEDNSKYVDKMQRYYVFWHKPMKDNGKSFMSYEYLDGYDNISDVDKFMRSEVKSEVSKTDLNRLESEYKQKVENVR